MININTHFFLEALHVDFMTTTEESVRVVRDSLIAHCRNMRALGRVSYIDQIENLNIETEMLMNEKLPDQV